MAQAYEFVEDVTNSVNGTGDLFSVQKPPYVVGSVRVYINGLLKRRGDLDGWTEENSVLGTVRLKEVPDLRPGHPIEPKDVVHIRYLTFTPPVVNPKDPIHITRLQRGDTVRIAMKPGYHLNPIANPKANPRLKSPRKGQSISGFSRTVFLAYINTNDPINGQMLVTVQKRTSCRMPHFEGLILYKNIQHIYRYAAGTADLIETAPASHPGARALGTFRRERIAPTLIKVLM